MGNIYRDTIEKPSDRVIVALDNMNWETATNLMQEVGPHVGMAKANALAQKCGWETTVDRFSKLGAFTMADAKYKDIPSTMENHLREVTECAPRLITIHADNTLKAIKYAVDGRNDGLENIVDSFQRASKDKLGGILGVTVMTSYDESDAISIYGNTPERKVLQFADAALDAGLDGIVCSSQELKALRSHDKYGDKFTVFIV